MRELLAVLVEVEEVARMTKAQVGKLERRLGAAPGATGARTTGAFSVEVGHRFEGEADDFRRVGAPDATRCGLATWVSLIWGPGRLWVECPHPCLHDPPPESNNARTACITSSPPSQSVRSTSLPVAPNDLRYCTDGEGLTSIAAFGFR